MPRLCPYNFCTYGIPVPVSVCVFVFFFFAQRAQKHAAYMRLPSLGAFRWFHACRTIAFTDTYVGTSLLPCYSVQPFRRRTPFSPAILSHNALMVVAALCFSIRFWIPLCGTAHLSLVDHVQQQATHVAKFVKFFSTDPFYEWMRIHHPLIDPFS